MRTLHGATLYVHYRSFEVPKTPTNKMAEALNCKVEATQETISFGL